MPIRPASLINGGATISYTRRAFRATSVTAPTNINIGTITVVGRNGQLQQPTRFLLTIFADCSVSLAPQSSSSTIAGTINERLEAVSTLAFALRPFFRSVQVTYTLQSTYFLVAPNTDNACDHPACRAHVVSTPEPASLEP